MWLKTQRTQGRMFLEEVLSKHVSAFAENSGTLLKVLRFLYKLIRSLKSLLGVTYECHVTSANQPSNKDRYAGGDGLVSLKQPTGENPAQFRFSAKPRRSLITVTCVVVVVVRANNKISQSKKRT